MDDNGTTSQVVNIRGDLHGKLVTCRVDELSPHPSYVRHRLAVAAWRLSLLAELGEDAFQQPLVITRDLTIVDGYARWQLAKLQGRSTLPCLEYGLSEAQALQWLLQRHRRSNGMNDFSRIVLAVDIEPLFKERARLHQRAGGEKKGSSNLTEAEKVDVRSEIAAAAGVSEGSVTKVKQLIRTAHPEILQALRSGEVRIHRAWLWSKLPPQEQRGKFQTFQSERGVKRTIRTLLAQHRSKPSPTVPDIENLPGWLSGIVQQIGPVRVAVIKAPGKAVFITEELFQALGPYEDLALTCPTNNP
jgi:hypothetical protein